MQWERSVSDADDVCGEARPVRRRGGSDDWRGDASGDSCATTRVRTGESPFQCRRLSERSRSDSIVIDLPTIVDEFADNFDALPIAYPDRPDYRVLVVGGTLAAASVVIGQLVADGSIVLLGIELDLDWPEEQFD